MSQGGGSFPFSVTFGEAIADKARAALENFGEVVERALKEFKTPGLGLAIVADGEVVLAEGYGFRDFEERKPADGDTLFAIGSCSKAFTTFLLGTLVDEGKLDWDEPVIKYLPDFRMKNDHSTRNMTVRDLVSHKSGLPRHDLVWYGSDASRRELYERIQHLEPFADLRERYHYQNLMFMVAGYLAEQIEGKSWEQLTRERILDPLGMKRSNFSVDDLPGDANSALAHGLDDDKVEAIPYRNIDTVGPAGSINSSPAEMARWLQVQLGGGEIDGTRVLQESTLREMHTPTTVIGGYPTDGKNLLTTYGLGWMMNAYRGHYRVSHGGGIDGFSAMVTVLPLEGYGIVALSNRGGTPASELVTRHAMDLLLGLEPEDWIGDAAKQQAEVEKVAEEIEDSDESLRVEGTSPSHPLEAYVGEYEHAGYGIFSVELGDDGGLTATYNGLVTQLEHWHYDVFNGLEGEGATLEDTKFLFRSGVRGEIEDLVVALDAAVDPTVFGKNADARLFDPEFLSTLTGRYKLATQVVEISLQGNVLVATLPGQPVYELVPAQGLEFELKGMTGFSCQFKENAEGKVDGLQFNQPNGVFTAERIED
ncbi:hypothetical protein ABI59_19795 [Acidobacteria bacterium Mor1]|nr:hypothetical protein ABI59_19795 [Acidobacteria bacterium Mor1]